MLVVVVLVLRWVPLIDDHAKVKSRLNRNIEIIIKVMMLTNLVE